MQFKPTIDKLIIGYGNSKTEMLIGTNFYLDEDGGNVKLKGIF